MSITAHSQASPIAAFVELLKPITWFPPMWAFGCGIVSAGVTPDSSDVGRMAVGVLLAGPLVCGASQIINDWFDRHVDAINEPGRPIPSGRIPGRWGLFLGIGWSMLALLVSAFLGQIVFAATVIGLALAWAYSAPPLRLKLNGWWGNAACGVCYEGLAWVTGAALMLGDLPPPQILTLAALYSVAAHGIMTLNDFKSIEGDRISGIRSLPVQLGPSTAGLVACAMMAVPQVVVIVLLDLWGHVPFAGMITLSLALQIYCMRRLLLDPRRHAPWYNATGVSLLVLGMLIAAIAVR